MPQSLARPLVHLVFSTKNREPLIANEHRERMFAYLGGTLNAIGCPTISIGGVSDHVHLLFALARSMPLSKAVEEVKKESSKWAKEAIHRAFYWQAFSVSPSNIEQVKEYIADQERHHRQVTFQEEFRELLRRHQIEWDERHVWD